MVKLDRLGDITSELSSNLVRSIVLPGGLLEWLSKPLPERLRDKLLGTVAATRSGEGAEPQQRLQVAAGPLVLMGGTPVPDESVVAMVHLAGGRSAKMAVIPCAAENHQAVAEQELRLFTRFGMRNLQVFDLLTRERAESPEWTAKLAEFDAVFLCGENAAVGIDVLRGTLAARTLREMLAAGKPLAGLDGAAAMLGDRVVVVRDGHEAVTEGLGLAPGLLLETAFTQESRFGRVVKALNAEGNSGLLGAGLDAGAALAVRDGEAKVLGETSVTFLDARESLAIPDPANTPPGALCGLKVHVLMDGFIMNLRTRKPGCPPKETPRAVGER
jgi:cyanophycinase